MTSSIAVESVDKGYDIYDAGMEIFAINRRHLLLLNLFV